MGEGLAREVSPCGQLTGCSPDFIVMIIMIVMMIMIIVVTMMMIMIMVCDVDVDVDWLTGCCPDCYHHDYCDDDDRHDDDDDRHDDVDDDGVEPGKAAHCCPHGPCYNRLEEPQLHNHHHHHHGGHHHHHHHGDHHHNNDYDGTNCDHFKMMMMVVSKKWG